MLERNQKIRIESDKLYDKFIYIEEKNKDKTIFSS